MSVQHVAMDEHQAVLLIHGQGRHVMFHAPIQRRPIQIDPHGEIFRVLRHEIRGQRRGAAEIFLQRSQGTAGVVLEIFGKKRNVEIRTLDAFLVQDVWVGPVGHGRTFPGLLTHFFHQTSPLFSRELICGE